MSAEQRFEAFKAAFAAGEDPDPRASLEGVEGAERIELTALIDAYLARAPAPAWDPEAFARFRTGPVARRVAESLAGQAEAGAERLADLRGAAEITRAALVDRLAEELDAPQARSRIAEYYHRLEWGTLDLRPVSGRVFDALARVLDVSAERVRAAAARALPPPTAMTHARTARPDPKFEPAPAPASAPAPAPAQPEQRDEIDRLFLGE